MAILGFGWVYPVSGFQTDSLIAMSFINTLWFGLIPVGLVLYLAQRERVDSLELDSRSDRNRVYPPALLLSLGYLIFSYHQSPWAFKWNLAIITVLALSWIVNIFWIKPSVHMAGTAGNLALVIALSNHSNHWLPLLISSLIFLLTLWARSALKAHTPVELLTGTLLGFIPTFAILLL